MLFLDRALAASVVVVDLLCHPAFTTKDDSQMWSNCLSFLSKSNRDAMLFGDPPLNAGTLISSACPSLPVADSVVFVTQVRLCSFLFPTSPNALEPAIQWCTHWDGPSFNAQPLDSFISRQSALGCCIPMAQSFGLCVHHFSFLWRTDLKSAFCSHD